MPETQAIASWATKNPDQVVDLLSPLLKLDKSILRTVTKRRNYGFEQITSKVIAEQQAIADTFFRLKLIPRSVKVADAVHASAIASRPK